MSLTHSGAHLDQIPTFRRAIPLALGLLLITSLAYLPTLAAGYIWDDDFYVTGNRALTSWRGLWSIWLRPGATPQYYPLVFTTFWFEHKAWGLNPAGYHAVNLCLHIASALLLWRVLTKLAVPGAFLASLLFALHPVQVESVAWITERKNTLSTFFYLLALLSWLRFQPLEDVEPRLRRNWGNYALAVLFFAAALFSKTITCSLPATILVLIWWKQARVRVADFAALLPFFALGVGLALVTIRMEQTHVGVEELKFGLTPLDRVLIAGRAAWFYLGKLLWPSTLTFIYPRWNIDRADVLQYVWPASAALLICCAWLLRRRISRGPLAALLLFGGTLLPALGIVDVYPMRYSFVADHFQYLASIPILALLAAGIVRFSRWVRLERTLPAVVGVLIAAALAFLTHLQARSYRDAETLWTDTIRKNPACWMAHNNLGAMRIQQGRFDEARGHIQQALAINANHPQAYTNLSWIALHEAKFDDAVAWGKRALECSAPKIPETYHNMARARVQQNLFDDALSYFDRALELNPTLTSARIGYADALIRVGRLDDAEAQLTLALTYEPGCPEAYARGGELALRRGDRETALDRLARAANGAPRDSRMAYNYAALASEMGRTREALEFAQRALALQPASADANNLLGSVLLHSGRAEDAIPHLTRAVSLMPGLIDARFNLAQACVAVGRNDEAKAHLAEILRVNPQDHEARRLLRQIER